MANFNFNTVSSLPQEVSNNLGWLPPEDRTDECKEASDKAIAEMPKFAIKGEATRTPVPFGDIASDHVFLWDAAKAVNGNKHFLCSYQRIGSCVGHGLYNALRYLMACEMIFRGEREQFKELFEPYGYGRSRTHAGIRGKGSGSTGSGAAKAAKVDGVLRRDFGGLSGWRETEDTIEWSDEVDTQWSDGARIEDKYLSEGRLHLVGETAQVNSANEVKAAIQNWYPCTIASNWGGEMRPSVKDGVLLNRRVTTWNHQMSVVGWMLHKTLGDIYWIPNSWSASAHGLCPTGAPQGGFWMLHKDLDNVTSQGDSFSFAGLNGFEARSLNFNVIG